jgi:hypothetical protein
MFHEQDEEFVDFDYENFVLNTEEDANTEGEEYGYANGDGNGEEYEDDYAVDNSDAFDDIDDFVIETDFSEVTGKSYKQTTKKVGRRLDTRSKRLSKRKAAPQRNPIRRRTPQPVEKQPRLSRRVPKKPLSRTHGVEEGNYKIRGQAEKKIGKVIVPRDRKVIVEGVSKFILSDKGEKAKKIGYYKGKKLRELNIIINNLGGTDFTVNLFDPSMPLDYLFSTGNNLNNKVIIAGGQVSYSDMLYNILANPTMIVKGQMNIAGASPTLQGNQRLFIYDKSIDGTQEITPFNIDLQVDTMQVFADVIYFDLKQAIGKPFIPDGMETIQYKVLAGNSVTFTFFYTQVSLKKFFYKEARVSKTRKLI